MFERWYSSAWHNPGSFWLGALAFTAWFARTQRFLTGFVVVFLVEIIFDAWQSGAWSPLVATPLATPVAITFVILGDLRFYLLLERYRYPRAESQPTPATVLVRSLGWALLVPLTSTAAQLIWPSAFENPRWIFLTYELAFLSLTVATRWARVERWDLPPATKRWLIRLCNFELVQYGLWVLADAILLTDASGGFALRLIPNTMYYVLFVPFAWATSPFRAEATRADA